MIDAGDTVRVLGYMHGVVRYVNYDFGGYEYGVEFDEKEGPVLILERYVMKVIEYNGELLAQFNNSWVCPKCGYDGPKVEWAASITFGGDKNILYVTCNRCGYMERCLTSDFEG